MGGGGRHQAIHNVINAVTEICTKFVTKFVWEPDGGMCKIFRGLRGGNL